MTIFSRPAVWLRFERIRESDDQYDEDYHEVAHVDKDLTNNSKQMPIRFEGPQEGEGLDP